MLRFVLQNRFAKPIAHAECVLEVEGAITALNTDGNGRVEKPIVAGARGGSLTLRAPQAPLDGVTISMAIGDLDPADERSGQRERLNNLGYFAGPSAEADEEADAALLSSAIEEFQCDHDLKVDGQCGPLTQAALKKAHGC